MAATKPSQFTLLLAALQFLQTNSPTTSHEGEWLYGRAKGSYSLSIKSLACVSQKGAGKCEQNDLQMEHHANWMLSKD
jgi:hypothetical protein